MNSPAKRKRGREKTRPLQPFIDQNPHVKEWLDAKFTDQGTRTSYAWHLREVCEAAKIKPDDLMKLLEDTNENELYGNLKRHLEALSRKKPRKAMNMRAALNSYVNHRKNRAGKFALDADLKVQQKWERPMWRLEQFNQVMRETNRRYRPLYQIGAMAGLGRKELVYLNDHLDQVQTIADIPEGCYIAMPARKSNSKKWETVLPTKEVEELKKSGPVLTTSKKPVNVFGLTQQFTRATERANIAEKGTSSHVLRSIFETVGDQAQIPEKYLEWNMGHFDRYHYIRSYQDLVDRAKALQPLWEFFRKGGPPTASRDELEAAKKQFDASLKEAQNKLDGKLVENWKLTQEIVRLVWTNPSTRRQAMKELEERWKELHPGEKEPEVKLVRTSKSRKKGKP